MLYMEGGYFDALRSSCIVSYIMSCVFIRNFDAFSKKLRWHENERKEKRGFVITSPTLSVVQQERFFVSGGCPATR